MTVFAILVFISGCSRNSAPKATVSSPAEASTYNAGEAIRFTAGRACGVVFQDGTSYDYGKTDAGYYVRAVRGGP
ncbi:MAG: hypothetical protein HY895_14390 [Deltaproteobacteria bacterium]|nr:hypothetical protein [Deltaproteobacteria bacterium]